MIIDNAGPLLTGVVSKLPELYRGGKSDSLIEFSRPARNEFLTLVESKLVPLPFMSDVVQSALTLVSGYYLSALTLLIDVPGLEVVKTLDQLNTKRDPIESMLGTGASIYKFVGTESYQHGLPKPEHSLFGFEADGDETTIFDENGNATSGRLGREIQSSIKELSNLSVGKQFEVIFARDGNEQPVQLQIRLMVTDTDSKSMMTILSMGSIKNTFKERFFRAKAGELSYIKDLVLCQDLIDEARATRIRDKSGFFEHIMRKRSGNFLSGLFTLRPSINNASAVIIISKETAKQLELELGGKLSQFAVREQVFKSTYAMLLIVIDEWEMVTFYHRSIDTPTEMRASELKRANKSTGSDVEDILRAYSSFSAPTL